MKHEEVFINGEDNGWLLKQNFWFDPEHPNGFEIVKDLNILYPEKYFDVDHVKPETVDFYCDSVLAYFQHITGKPLINLIEFGSGGGWFLKKFIDKGIDVKGLEGSKAGVDACMKRGIHRFDIDQCDFRIDFSVKFDVKPYEIALCTEVAEHIEPPFTSALVSSLCESSDLVWFSFEPPNTNPAHRHHPNEMPAKFWINLFEFYGYGCYMLPDHIFEGCEGRGRMIFYSLNAYPNGILEKTIQ